MPVQPSPPSGNDRRATWWTVAAVVAAVVVVVVTAATTVWALTRSGGTRPDEPVVDPIVKNVKAVRAAAAALAARPYEVDFDFTWREPDMSAFQARAINMVWSGTMRSTGGDSPQWTLSSEVTYKQEDGSQQRLDAVTIVDDGQTRYFDTLNTTFDGLEWAAITGSGRVNNFWRPAYTTRTGEAVPARAAPMPEVNPLDYLDIMSPSYLHAVTNPGIGTRYTIRGIEKAAVLGDRTARPSSCSAPSRRPARTTSSSRSTWTPRGA